MHLHSSIERCSSCVQFFLFLWIRSFTLFICNTFPAVDMPPAWCLLLFIFPRSVILIIDGILPSPFEMCNYMSHSPYNHHTINAVVLKIFECIFWLSKQTLSSVHFTMTPKSISRLLKLLCIPSQASTTFNVICSKWAKRCKNSGPFKKGNSTF